MRILFFWPLSVTKDENEAGIKVGDLFSSALAGFFVQSDR